MIKISFSFLSGVIFGCGVLYQLVFILKKKGIKKVFVTTDDGLIRAGVLKKLEEVLLEVNCQYIVYSDIEEDPSMTTVERGSKLARSYNPDLIIALGGGSVMDTAKMIALLFTNRGLTIYELRKAGDSKRESLPVITIPTTAGTGSEVTTWAVITDQSILEKISIGGPEMAPLMAVIDPALTLTLPADLTLWTGIDALVHALEAYLSKDSNYMTDFIACRAIEYIVKYLPEVVENGSVLEAREKMILASSLAGWAMQNAGLGLIHGIAHQIGALYHTRHGLTNALLLPAVLKFNYPCCQEKLLQLNYIFTDINNYKGDILNNFNIFCEQFELYNLQKKNRLKIKQEDAEKIAWMALRNVNSRTNPRQPGLNDIINIIDQTYNY